ncbi:FAD binding domain protein [Geosmithia morbida]|uniref:L-ornithine N(5)-monooxygenase [NAD(P)H] n=1 Tax=Geosmithia morbida TaxID=1094350 RepID=A0A9P5D5C0_9HYPO|nr:FAD binding domain protein [Geosmithia morbida]KAF4127037.1 FAD binding domain protein [Geosmithia morbida]
MSPMLQEEDVYDVLIVGAGPCGLATAARLREHAPDALFTDEEHRRYHWIGKYGNKVSLKNVRSGKKTSAKATRRPEYKMAVLDSSSDAWLGRWKSLFKTFDIQHLRSPMLWHVDPLDRDALLAHAYRTERQDELVEIRHCVGKEISKHAKKKQAAGPRAYGGKSLTVSRQAGRVAINLRDRNDYYTPSQALFCDHCQDVATRYNLGDDIIHKESVEDIDHGVVRGISIDGEKLFTVTTNTMRRFAKVVILAVGPANVPYIPRTPSMAREGPIEQACHSMQIKSFPDPIVMSRMNSNYPTNILIVGGGLTSAQLADLAIRKGVTKVWLLMRGPLKLKHFDVDLNWMGKYKNAEQSRFWTADTDEERLEIIKEARGGGSVTPLFNKRVKKHMASGKLELMTHTTIKDAKLDGEGAERKWSVELQPAANSLPKMDFIYFATGIQTDFSTLPYLQKMIEKYPIKAHGGFPCLTEDLSWREDVPLFMAGRLACLQLGPAAPNIGGAKVGAERIAWAVEDLIKPTGADEWEDINKENGMGDYLSGHGNMYSALASE